MSIDYGTDIRVAADTEDADDLFSEVSGVALVQQDLRHRLLTDSVLPSPTGDASGIDVRRFAGMPAALLAGQQPNVKRVVLADDRISSATVTITDDGKSPLRTVTITVYCLTALGPFRLVFILSSTDTGTAIRIIEDQ